jgi:hypothetical protein
MAISDGTFFFSLFSPSFVVVEKENRCAQKKGKAADIISLPAH